jgi:type IV pilus assembly protein PilQ
MKTNWAAIRFGCLLMTGAAFAAWSAQAQMAHEAATAAAAPAASISSVKVAHAGQQTTVLISGNSELRYRTSRLDNPPRLVLDFADTRLALPRSRVSSDYEPVREVRTGQPAPGVSRVVIDLEKFVPYQVQGEGSDIKVSFAATPTPHIPANFRPARNAAGRELQAVKAPDMPLPTWITGNSLAFARPASEPPAPKPQAVRTLAAYQAPAAQQPGAGPSAAQYTGAPISVNLKDVDLKDFFRLIHEISGLNVVLDPAVKGSVTLVLDEVPWDQALDIVLQNNGLDKEIQGNVLRIVTQDTLRKEAEAKRDLARAQEQAINVVTTTRVLSYAKADAMAATVKKFLSARGDVLADPRSNTLIISDIPSNLPKIDNLIRQLDRKGQQVEIDARVVAATRSFARDVGTQFAFSAGMNRSDGSPQNVFGGDTSVGTSTITHPTSLPPPLISSGGTSMPLNTNLAASAPTSGVVFAHASPNFALDFLISAAESKGVGKLLSEPKGVTQNNEKLTVKQGTKVPIQTTINNTVSVQYIDAVLKLEVTPQITAEGTVFMDVTVENTQIDQGIPRVQGIPALATQSTETKVLVNDGGTVVIGGVVINSQRTDIAQVPLVGSVPLIGHLFKRTTVNVQSQELLFFVTPRILPG